VLGGAGFFTNGGLGKVIFSLLRLTFGGGPGGPFGAGLDFDFPNFAFRESNFD